MEEKKDQYKHIKVTSEVHRLVKLSAANLSMTMNDLVRLAVKTYVTKLDS